MSEEITTAIQHTLRALPLSEKVLAHELLYSEQYYEPTRSVWLRAPVFDLHEAIETARAGTKGRDVAEPMFRVRNFYITCDTLVIKSSKPAITNDTGVWHIEICARKIIAPKATQSLASLVLESEKGCSLRLSTASLPESFEIEFRTRNSTKKVSPTISKGYFSVEIGDDDTDELSQEQLPAPDSFMNTLSYLDRISTEDGKLKSRHQRNDDLPRLLQMQMLISQAHIAKNKDLSVELLNYVIAASSNEHSLELNYQAVSLRNTLLVSSEVVYVPSVNIFASKQVLKARLISAKAYEDRFQQFSNLTSDSRNRTSYALDLLARSDDASETYHFLLDIRQREYDNALAAYQKANTIFAANQKSIETLKTAFEAGIKKYKKNKEIESVKSVFKGIFEVGIAIAATVATAGAAAPITIPGAGAAIGSASKVVVLFNKLKEVYEKLKSIYEKIKPVITALQQVVVMSINIVQELGKLKNTTDKAKSLQAGAMSPDIYNATAEWRKFNLTVMDMENTLHEYEIEGKAAFFLALKTLVINGEAFIQAQANLVVKGDELATTVLQSKMEKRNHDRMSKMAYVACTDEAVFGLLRRAMFDRLLQIRGLVYSDFSTYVAAYNYHTMLPEQIISLSPVKPVVDYLEDAAKLQAAVVSFGSRAIIQSRKFQFRTLAGFSSGEELATQLSKGPIDINVAPTEKIFRGFTRIRVSAVRCYLDGAQANPGETLQLKLQTDGHFFDRELMDRDFVAENSDMEKAVLTRSFLSEGRQLLFEYEPFNGAIVCDGKFGQVLDYTKHTPMTNWSVKLTRARRNSGLDLSSLKEIVMEFECDILWTGIDSTETE